MNADVRARNAAILRLCRPQVLDAGQTLFLQGDPGDSLYLVETGLVEVSVLSEAGRKLTLDLLGPGAILGEIALFDPGPRTATATALGPVRLQTVSRSDLRSGLARDPDVAMALLALAGQRMRAMTQDHSEHVFRPLPARLARRLRHVAERDPQGLIRLTQGQLADFVGGTRETVSKTLNRWKRDGVLAAEPGGLRILDDDTLQSIAEEAEFDLNF